MRDVFTDALNAPSGLLAEIMLKKLTKGSGTSELSDDMRKRLERLVGAPGKAGKLARVRLAAEVSYLFERAPTWTKSKILPLFDWASADAADVWESLKYSKYIRSPGLFGLIKKPFLEMFGRSGVTSDELRTFAEWSPRFPSRTDPARMTFTRLRRPRRVPRCGEPVWMRFRALDTAWLWKWKRRRRSRRRSGGERLSVLSFRRFGRSTSMQSHASTFKLAQILMATGEAFPEAAEVIIPFIRPDDPRSQLTIFSIAEAPKQLYALSPSKMIDLVAAVVGEASPGSVFALSKALSRIRALEPSLANTRKFQRLLRYASASGPPA